jgi:molecular chaperone DnaJ
MAINSLRKFYADLCGHLPLAKKEEIISMTENCYDILGIPEGSDLQEIKRAYRSLAKKFHPDKNHNPDTANFNKVTEAYDTLSDAEKRKEHDSHISREKPHKSHIPSGSDLKIAIHASALDIIRGVKKIVVTKRKCPCPTCDGTGSASKKIKKCVYCNGTGWQGLSLLLGQKRKCPYCIGIGFLPDGEKCKKCLGMHQIIETLRHEITLNPISNYIVIPDAGNYPIGQGKPGDLIVELNITQDHRYNIQGLNIETVLSISPAQAVLGDDLPLHIFDRQINFHIPSGTGDRDIIEQENCGVSYEGKTGMLRARIKIEIPKIISEKEKELYKELLNTEKEQPWPTVLTF